MAPPFPLRGPWILKHQAYVQAQEALHKALQTRTHQEQIWRALQTHLETLQADMQADRSPLYTPAYLAYWKKIKEQSQTAQTAYHQACQGVETAQTRYTQAREQWQKLDQMRSEHLQEWREQQAQEEQEELESLFLARYRARPPG